MFLWRRVIHHVHDIDLYMPAVAIIVVTFLYLIPIFLEKSTYVEDESTQGLFLHCISWYKQMYCWNGPPFWPVKYINGMQFSSFCYFKARQLACHYIIKQQNAFLIHQRRHFIVYIYIFLCTFKKEKYTHQSIEILRHYHNIIWLMLQAYLILCNWQLCNVENGSCRLCN